MNRTEAKAYALNELGLDRDTVRQFGNLSRTQTWLDAIAAQASGGIAAEEASNAHKAMSVEVTLVEDVTDVEATLESAIPEPVPQGDSFETFWDSAPVLLHPQPLVNVSALDGDWDEPQLPTAQVSEVIVYPIVIGLLMLWAMVQLLLLVSRGLAIGLTALANRLDAAATHRLNTASSQLLPPPNFRGTTLVLG